MNKLKLSRLELNFLFNPRLLFLRYIVDKVEYILRINFVSVIIIEIIFLSQQY